MCRPPENPANIRKHTVRRSVPATLVVCVLWEQNHIAHARYTARCVVRKEIGTLHEWTQLTKVVALPAFLLGELFLELEAARVRYPFQQTVGRFDTAELAVLGLEVVRLMLLASLAHS